MLKSLARTIKKASRTFNKTSPWFKGTLILVLILLALGVVRRNSPVRENFIQQAKFVSKEGTAIYDQFYADIYNDLLLDKVKNEYEVGEILNITSPTERSLILDVGSGTGQHVALFNQKGVKTQGIDISPAMVSIAEKNFPAFEFRVGDALQASMYPSNTFTHITSLYFTLYYMKNKLQFFQNAFNWLQPSGYLIIHLVNRDQFDPILNAADPLHMVSAQRYAKERITSSFVKFNNFQYKANFILDKPDNLAFFEETFKDDKTGHVRKQTHTLYMPTQKYILSLAKSVGFVLEGKIDLLPVQYEYQYLYVLYKPE